METNQTQPETSKNGRKASRIAQDRDGARTRPGPLRRVLNALRRDPEPSVVQVMAEWAEYQIIFNDILQRLSAHLARQAKVEKKRLARIADQIGEDPTAITPPAQVNVKQALRSQYALSRYGGRVQELLREKERGDYELSGKGE